MRWKEKKIDVRSNSWGYYTYTTNSEKNARAYIFIEAEKHSMKFHQEISQYGCIDFIFYYANDENKFDVFTIIKN